MKELKISKQLVGRRAVCLASILLCLDTGWAQAEPAAIDAPATEAAREVEVLEYVVRGNTVLDIAAIERAVTPFLGPHKTLKDIEAARDALLAAYQAKGYQSVYVDLPEQQVVGGLVFLQVNETRVGRVRVVGSEYNSPVAVREQVPAMREGAVPDFNQAQRELSALNRTSNRQVMPLVRQGALPGTMDVDLKVEDSSPWHASVGVNNDKSANTKDLRLTASVRNDNLWQLGHSASITVFMAPENIDQTLVWLGSYVAPLRGTNWSLEASAYSSDSNVSTMGGTSVTGKGSAVGIKASYTVPDTGSWWHNLSAGVEFKDNEEALRFGQSADTVPLKYAPITLAYSGYYQGGRLQYGLGFSLVTGMRSAIGWGSDWKEFDYKRYKASPSFQVVKADYNGNFAFANESQLGWRLSGQLSDSALVSGEQMAAGGTNSVRGYLSAAVLGDVGMVGSVEWRTKPLTYFSEHVEAWRAYVFADAGRLQLVDPLPEQQDTFSLASVGVGTSFQVGQSLSARLDLGYPLKASPTTERYEPRLTFNLSASY
jgi:hemolysin activation/secretion protein